MNNKSMYAILCVLSLLAMLTDLPERYQQILNILICGGALYDAVKVYRTGRKVTLRMVGMIVVAVLTNPIYTPSDSFAVRVSSYLLAALLFFFAQKTETLLPEGNTSSYEPWEEKDIRPKK